MRTLPFRTAAEVEAAAEAAREQLKGDGIVAYPTETVYGFGTLLLPSALRELAALKRREAAKPFLLLVRSAGEAPGLAWTPEAERLAAAFWPGPLTLVLGDPGQAYPPGVRSAAGGVAVRATPHPGVRALLAVLPGPLTSSSANLPGAPPARSGAEAAESARRLGGHDVLVLDGGTLPAAAPSTIVDCTLPGAPRLVRAGAVPLEELRTIVESMHG